ncbi:MAG: acyl-CoA dehydrogenase family protein [Rhodanobacter sp.]
MPEVEQGHGDSRQLQEIAEYAAAELRPLAQAIDQQGLYPRAFLVGLGQRGGFGSVVDGDPRVDLPGQLRVIAEVGRHCGATAFLAWCQSACVSYLAHAPLPGARQRYLQRVSEGGLLAGTGMSNALKHLAGIEKIRLRARSVGDGYVVDGMLPWVSNLDRGHLLLTAAALSDGGYVMLAIETGADGVALHACPAFCGMEGTSTWNVRLHSVAVAVDGVLARPAQFDHFLNTIKPGLVLTQAGMGLGVIAGCVDDLAQAAALDHAANDFLVDGVKGVRAELAGLRADAEALAQQARTAPPQLLAVLRLRAQVSELALRAAQSAMLHVGARGYLLRHPAQRRLREAMFVSIVTPALKHLRKEIFDIERAHAEVA